MDKETREFLEGMQAGMNEFRSEVNKRFDSIDSRLGKLEEGQERLEKKQEEIKTILGELEPLNDNRYLELKNAIDDLRRNLSTVGNSNSE